MATGEADAPDVVPPVVPARMLNEHVYCRRLAYLEWVDARFIDNQDTVEGRFAHRRVDATRGASGCITAHGSGGQRSHSTWPRSSVH
jgi:hypothetical protein